MRGIIRIALVSTLVAGGIAFLVFGTDAVSYISAAVGMTRDGVRKSLPLELELRRARDFLGKVEAQMDSSVRAFSRQEVSAEELRTRIQEMESSGEVPKLRQRLVALKTAMSHSGVSVQYDGGSINRKEAEARLTSLFRWYRARSELRAQLVAALRAKTEALRAMETRLLSLRSDRDRLAAEIDRVEALMHLAKATGSGTEATDGIPDATRRIEQILCEVQNRLKVMDRETVNRERFMPRLEERQTDLTREGDVVKAVEAYLESEEAAQQ